MAANRELNVSLHQRSFSPVKTHTQVFLALYRGSGPRQCSFTSKLFSTVYYTEVILAPRARFPKRKLFLYTYKWKKAGRLQCNPFSFVWSWNSIHDFFACIAFLLYLFFNFVSFSILLLVLRQELNDEKHKPSENKYCSEKRKPTQGGCQEPLQQFAHCCGFFFSSGQTDNGQKMTMWSIFENRLAPFYAFHFGPRPLGSEPSQTIF